MTQQTPDERAIDDLLAAFQIACITAHTAQNAPNPDEALISRTAMERAIQRNELRARLRAARSSGEPVSREVPSDAEEELAEICKALEGVAKQHGIDTGDCDTTADWIHALSHHIHTANHAADSVMDDAAALALLEEQGVTSIYLRDGSQFNPGILSLGAAIRSTFPRSALSGIPKTVCEEPLAALRRIGIVWDTESDDEPTWTVCLEPHGERPCDSLDEALARVLKATENDVRASLSSSGIPRLSEEEIEIVSVVRKAVASDAKVYGCDAKTLLAIIARLSVASPDKGKDAISSGDGSEEGKRNG